jgi:hypothetical protein
MIIVYQTTASKQLFGEAIGPLREKNMRCFVAQNR